MPQAQHRSKKKEAGRALPASDMRDRSRPSAGSSPACSTVHATAGTGVTATLRPGLTAVLGFPRGTSPSRLCGTCQRVAHTVPPAPRLADSGHVLEGSDPRYICCPAPLELARAWCWVRGVLSQRSCRQQPSAPGCWLVLASEGHGINHRRAGSGKQQASILPQLWTLETQTPAARRARPL